MSGKSLDDRIESVIISAIVGGLFCCAFASVSWIKA